VRDALIKSGLYHEASAHDSQAADASPVATQWRLAPSPFIVTPDEVAFFESLGQHLLSL